MTEYVKIEKRKLVVLMEDNNMCPAMVKDGEAGLWLEECESFNGCQDCRAEFIDRHREEG